MTSRDELPSQAQVAVTLTTGLTPSERTRVKDAARLQRLPSGKFFFRQGDPAEAVYQIETGRVRLSQVTAEGQQILLRVISAPTVFGAIALTNVDAYPVTAEADEDCSAWVWPRTALMALVDQIPRLALNAMQLMAGHVQEFQDRFREIATQRVERRLARTLLRLASQTGRKIDEGVLIDLSLTRQDLAEMTGTTLYTVSRILSQWETQGLVHSGRERVVIRFPHGLVRIAEDLD